ncbi:MAG: hypothetical protein WBN95_09995 [Gammaproteobacteria bacterium]
MNAYADRLARQQLRSLEMIMADQGYKQTVQFPAWLAAAIPGLSIAAVKSSRFQYYFFRSNMSASGRKCFRIPKITSNAWIRRSITTAILYEANSDSACYIVFFEHLNLINRIL